MFLCTILILQNFEIFQQNVNRKALLFLMQSYRQRLIPQFGNSKSHHFNSEELEVYSKNIVKYRRRKEEEIKYKRILFLVFVLFILPSKMMLNQINSELLPQQYFMMSSIYNLHFAFSSWWKSSLAVILSAYLYVLHAAV